MYYIIILCYYIAILYVYICIYLYLSIYIQGFWAMAIYTFIRTLQTQVQGGDYIPRQCNLLPEPVPKWTPFSSLKLGISSSRLGRLFQASNLESPP